MQILSNGLRLAGEQVQYAWYHLRTPQGPCYRAIVLFELKYLPIETRDDPDLLGKQWAALRGLHNAQVDFVYTVLGRFAPSHLGITQLYGAAAQGRTEDEAAQRAIERAAAVQAVLANYAQSRLAAPAGESLSWFANFIYQAPFALACLGHPDPRQAKRGLGRDGALGEADEDLASQQNELLFRGLTKLRQNFVFLVTADHIARGTLTQGLLRVAEVAGSIASRRKGNLSIGASISIPIMNALASQRAAQHAAGTGQTRAASDGVSEQWSTTHTDSRSHTSGHSVSVGESENWGTSQAHTTGHGTTVSHSEANTQSHGWGQSDTQSTSHTQSSSQSIGSSASTSWSHSEGAGQSMTNAQGTSHAESQGTSASTSVGMNQSHSDGNSTNQSYGVNGGVDVRPTDPENAPSLFGWQLSGVKAGGSAAVGMGTSMADGTAVSGSVGQGASHNVMDGSSQSHATGTSHTTSDSVGGSFSTSVVTSTGSATTTGSAHSTSENWGTAKTTGTTRSESSFSADTVGSSHGWGTQRSESFMSASTVGTADSQGHGTGRSHAETVGATLAQSSAAGQGFGLGFSTGFVPGVSLNRSWQVEDDVADRLAEVLRGLEALLNQASAEGGFMTDAYLFLDSAAGARAAAALVPQAFHGPTVPTPVLTLPIEHTDLGRARDHALAWFTNADLPDGDPFGGLLWRKYSTLLTSAQLAAYTAPGLFEEGSAGTTQEKIPAVAFYPHMRGEVLLGHQISPETGDLTTCPLVLDKARFFHTAFAGDTGYGKSAGAQRMVYESALRWGLRTIVFDFGAGWRSLYNAPGLTGRVSIYQLWPGAPRALRWNPLQIGRFIPPEIQWRAFTDIFTAVAHLGVKRQAQELREALRQVYLGAGVLVDDPELKANPTWNKVRVGEDAIASATAGTLLTALTPAARQALAVARSKAVGLVQLYAQLEKKLAEVPPKDAMLRGVLEGILFRLNPLVQGGAAEQFAAGPDTLAIEALGGANGVCILEGGAFLDEFSKALLLGWAAWQIYTDAVRRRQPGEAQDQLQLVFEEANKILGGAPAGGSEDEGSSGPSTGEQFAAMWRDSRKYGIWLHVITQSPALMPKGILSSCNNIVVGQLKEAKDRDLAIAHLARSEKGLTDEDWRRFLARLPIGWSVAKLGYSRDMTALEPVLIEPLMLAVPEPSDAALAMT